MKKYNQINNLGQYGKKGAIPWNKGKHTGQITWITGKHHSPETRKKISAATKGKQGSWKGKHHTPESNEKNRLAHLGKSTWNKGTKGLMNPWNKGLKGIHLSSKSEFKKGMNAWWMKGLTGKKHPSWKGGISFEPYGIEFNDQLKEKIRKKYNYRCQQCFRHQDELRTKANRKHKLMIHHIDYNKKNNSENNLIPLCISCHAQTGFNREDWTKYFKNKVQ